MRASVWLANFAKVSDGMVDTMGAGWTQIGPGPVSFFVAGLLSCEWHELNVRHETKLELLDADGEAVPHPENRNPIVASFEWEVGKPPGTKAGASLNAPFVIPFGAFELEEGEQYVVVVSVDGEGREEWRLPFTVREAPPQRLAA